ncbi:MAG TPA: ABC transporter permease [Longimicrobiaceae bacterium]|nr:ABC transporter permease [Longimicrobiaceae bacterium]
MSPAPMWRRYLRFLGRDVPADVEDELQFHLEMRTRELIARGVEPEEARHEALRRFGDLERIRKECEEVDRVVAHRTERREWWDGIRWDLRYAARMLRRSPGFTLAAILTLALGIGATTAIFGAVVALFLRPPAGVYAPDEVVRLYVVRREGGITTPTGGPGSYLDFRAMRTEAHGFSDVAAFLFPGQMDYGRGESARRIRGQGVTGNFFSLLGVRPALGRFFLPEEDSIAGAHPVAVLGHTFWKSEFGGDPGVLGESLLLNGQLLTVVGVAAPEFTGVTAERIDVWVPTAMADALGLTFGGAEWRDLPLSITINFVGRLAPGNSREQAAASAAAALRRAAEGVARLDPAPEVLLGSLNEARGPHRAQSASVALWLLLVTGVLLLIACANVANLLLARAATRQREIAVRLALGAGGWRLVRQLLSESVLLGLLGGTAGLLVALWGAGLIRQFPLPAFAGQLDLRLLGFALAVSLAAGLLFGLMPALQATHTDPATALRGGGSPGSPGRGRLRAGLVVAQVALSLPLLVAAGLFVRSLGQVHAVDAGVDLDRVLVVSVDLEKAGYGEADREGFYAAALERLHALPGVERAALARFAPFSGSAASVPFDVPGRDTLYTGEGPYTNAVGLRFFATVGMPILRGRGFADSDRQGSAPVAVVNETMARVIAPEGDAVGACIPLGTQTKEGGCTEIVGIAADSRHRLLEEQVVPYIYLPRAQHPGWAAWAVPSILVRTRRDPPAMIDPVRSAIQQIAPDLPYVSVQPMSELIRNDVLPFRLGAVLFSLFGVLALTLAAVGLYGVLAYLVAERTREIGVRLSLGARRGDVVRLVVLQGMRLVVIGLGLGLVASFFGARLLEGLLFGISARDPLTFVGIAAVLAATGALASFIPARRAARVDPMVALRHE